MTNPTAPPPHLLHEPSSPSFSSLPDEIIVNCLARISQSYYRSLCLVSKSFYSFVSSLYIYAVRSQTGATEPRLHICLRSLTYYRWYTLDQTLTPNGDEIKNELTLGPRKRPPSNLSAPLQTTIVAVGYEIYQIGGTDNCSSLVRVLDCRNNTWRDALNMKVARKRAKSCFLDGKIYVMGGCGRRDQSKNWGEVFDVKTQTWKPFPRPEDDVFHWNHKVVVSQGKIYIITMHKKYAYDPKEGRWLLDEGFVSLGSIMDHGPWCVIENVIFTELYGRYWWYDPGYGVWLMVCGLGNLYLKRGDDFYSTIQLVNYGGKLVTLWEEEDARDWSQPKKENFVCGDKVGEGLGFSRTSDFWSD